MCLNFISGVCVQLRLEVIISVCVNVLKSLFLYLDFNKLQKANYFFFQGKRWFPERDKKKKA